jgi:uncharacterized caspase-like protein
MYSTARIAMLLGCIAVILTVAGCAVGPGKAPITEHFFNIEAQRGSLTNAALGKVTLGYGSPNLQFKWAGTQQDRFLLPALKSELQSANLFGADRTAPYTLAITVQNVKQGSAMLGYGTTTVELGVNYELRDGTGAIVYRRLIDSEGSHYAFGGGTRARMARTEAAKRNVAQFVNELATRIVRLQTTATAATSQVAPAQAPTVAIPQAVMKRPPTTPTDLPPVTLESSSGEGIAFGNYHALIIGNNRYHHLQGLQSAVRDARRLDEVLRTNYGFKTKLLIDATRNNILSELNSFRQNLTREDNLLIYYAGHGWVDEAADEGYWLPVDAAPDNPVNWLSNASLTATVRAINAKHVLVVADSCFSGKLTRGINVQIRASDYLTRMARKRSRTALTSGGLEPVLDAGGKEGHSIFASAFIQALSKNEAVIDMSQMFSFIRRHVALAADQIPEYGDIRRAGHDGGDFLFVRVH